MYEKLCSLNHTLYFYLYTQRTGISTQMCEKLWCEVEGEKYCMSKLDAAAQGTECAPNKVNTNNRYF